MCTDARARPLGLEPVRPEVARATEAPSSPPEEERAAALLGEYPQTAAAQATLLS